MRGPGSTPWDTTVDVISDNQIIARLPAGMDVYFIGVDPVEKYVYVPSGVSETMSVISGAQIVGSVPVGKLPSWPAVNPKSGYMYVPNSWSDDVTIIDRGRVIETIPVGAEPSFVAINPNSNLVYVSNYFGQSITILQEPIIVRSLTPHFLSASDENFVLEFSEPVITCSIQFVITPSINFTVTWDNSSTTRLSISHEPVLQGHPMVLQVLPGGAAPSHIPVASPTFNYAIAYQSFLPVIRKNS
jgi:YVTN family beta-propeller protein